MLISLNFEIFAFVLLIFVHEIILEEFCSFEIFEPKCLNGEVLQLKEVLYGRKNLGRCLEKDKIPMEDLRKPGYLNCYADVRHIIGPQCSAKSHCEVGVALINVPTNCQPFLKNYLEVDYQCLKIFPDNHHCSMKVGSEKQHIFGVKQKDQGCGGEDKRWKVESMVGKKLNFGLLQLTWPNNTEQAEKICQDCLYFAPQIKENEFGCKPFALLIERDKNLKTAVCYDNKKKEKNNIFRSDSNNLEIQIEERNTHGISFLFAIEATGCSNIIPPADAYFKRDASGMEATVSCYASRVRWQLVCDGQHWKGVIGNCSHSPSHFDVPLVKPKPPKTQSDQIIIPVVAILMVGAALCLLIICVGVILFKHYSSRKARALKQMNCIYNNSVKMPPINPSYQDAPRPLNNVESPYYYGENGGAHREEGGQYFELDQALVNKEILQT